MEDENDLLAGQSEEELQEEKALQALYDAITLMLREAKDFNLETEVVGSALLLVKEGYEVMDAIQIAKDNWDV